MLPLVLLALAAGENLLRNPGFEELAGDAPSGWDLYIEPAAGAEGLVSDTAHEGQRAAALAIAVPYPTDPFNNWSQNVFGDFALKPMEVSAWVKAENAGEVVVWVQCWQRQPGLVLHVANTGDLKQVRDTTDWQEVTAAFTPPAGTDFLTVRCILRGAGKAWFDTLSLRVGEEAPKEKPAPAEPAPPPPEAAAPPEVKKLDALEDNLEEMRRGNRELLETVRGMREENSALQEELQHLRQQLEEMKSLLDAPAQEPAEAEAAETETPARVVPPLVPHGEDPARYGE